MWARQTRPELQTKDPRELMATGADLEEYLNRCAAGLGVVALLVEIEKE